MYVAYAAATTTTTWWEKIRDAARPGSDARPARGTTTPYVESLTRLRVLDDIPAWIPSRNHLNRVGQAPKHHLVDPRLAARLLGLSSADLLRGEGPDRVVADGTFLGALFESLAAMSVDAESMLDAVVLTTGTHAYRRPDGVAVVPLGLLGP